MSDLETDVLRCLRVFGPCSNHEVARRLKCPPSRSYRTIQRLCVKGLAVHLNRASWDITEKGRRVFRDMPTMKLRLME